MLKTIALSLSMLALCGAASAKDAAPAAPIAPATHDCFLNRHTISFTYVDPHHMRIHAGPNRDYLLSTDFDARELRWSEAIALRSTPSDWICTGNGIGVDIIGGHPRERYPVRDIVREAPTPPAQAPAHKG